jgi:hypothetical protein
VGRAGTVKQFEIDWSETEEEKRMAEFFSIFQLSAAPQIQPPVREY